MSATKTRLLLFNKPYGVLSQFSDKSGDKSGDKSAGQAALRQTLADYISAPRFYPAGRLDRDSEGLLLLTDNGKLQSQISHPRYKLLKTYYVQVEGSITAAALDQLQQGVTLKDGPARAVSAAASNTPDWLWPRVPPIRQRKTVTDSWLVLAINEGRNRQVRRMTAAVGFPTLRLVRYAIGDWDLQDISSGKWIEVEHLFESSPSSSNKNSSQPHFHSVRHRTRQSTPRKR